MQTNDKKHRNILQKIAVIFLTVLSFFSVSVFARMINDQGNGMMVGGWRWGRMNSGPFFMIIIAILVILGIFYLRKRR